MTSNPGQPRKDEDFDRFIEKKHRERIEQEDAPAASLGGDSQHERDSQRALEKIREFNLTPRDVKEKLDEDVIKQDRAKKYLANAVCYHYGRVKRELELPEEERENDVGGLVKKNVLMIGNTGVGKSYLARKISDFVGAPYVKKDATKYSATGYVGGNVEDMVVDLFLAANKNVQLAQYGIIYLDEIDKIRSVPHYGKDVSGVEVQRGLLKLMEETEVDVSFLKQGILLGGHELGLISKDKKNEKQVINTRHILFIMAGAFPGLEEIVNRRAGIHGDRTGKKTSLQEEAKKVYEKHPFPALKSLAEEPPAPEEDDSWYNQLTSQDLIDYGFEAEFVGRLPIRATLDDLNEDDLFAILKLSGDSLLKQYVQDFQTYDINVSFTDEALHSVASRAVKEKTGARALVGVLEKILLDFLFELPSAKSKELVVDQRLIEHPRERLLQMTLEPLMERYGSQFEKQYGITIQYTPEAVEALREKLFALDVDVRTYCASLMDRFGPALKNYRGKNFSLTVNAEIIRDPDQALKKIVHGGG